jgi:broad-specificity NMP kinase
MTHLEEVISKLSIPFFVFITGASGSGKTTIMNEFKKQNVSPLITIYHFDDIGVPNFQEMIKLYGSVEKWQKVAARQWVETLTKITDKKLINLEGSFDPEFVMQILQKFHTKNYFFICITANKKMREERLISRGHPELVTENMEQFSRILIQKTKQYDGFVINTTNRSVKDSVEEIQNIITEKVRKTYE